MPTLNDSGAICSPATQLHQEYRRRCKTKSDIHLHLPRLRELAVGCETVVEYGVRTGNSTIALLDGLCDVGGRLVSFDIAQPALTVPPLPGNVKWEFRMLNTAYMDPIRTDGLFIDTWHTAAQVYAELTHSVAVNHWIALHDTHSFGVQDEKHPGPGLWVGIMKWMREGDGLNWRVDSYDHRNNGLLVLRRR